MSSSIKVEVYRHSSETPWHYSQLDFRQRQLAQAVRLGDVRGGLLLSEVAPVITLGRRTSEKDLLDSPENLIQKGIELYSTDRGGRATYHGPGQWVLFPVGQLRSLVGDPRGVRKVVEALLESAQAVGLLFEPQVEIRWGAEMGVWTPRGKFAAVGIHIEQGVLLHGLSLNGFRTPLSFHGLRPCGLDAPVDFLLGNSKQEIFESLGIQLAQEVQGRLWNKANPLRTRVKIDFRDPRAEESFPLEAGLTE